MPPQARATASLWPVTETLNTKLRCHVQVSIRPTNLIAALSCIALTLLTPRPASAQRDLTDIPEPNPVAEQAQMTTADQSEVNLFAADPDFSKPIQINFDSTGGLWVASSEVYPQIEPGQVANDKIVVLRDTDGDGVADDRKVFADGLLIPTGILPDGPNAAYVAESTRLVYLTDTDGDGVADKRRVVLSGFGTEDTHHLIHTLRFGPDGCVYFNQSIYIHSHIETAFGTRHLDGGGIWRYRPDTGRLEIVCKGFVNPWGHSFDAFGESFVTDGAYFEGINYAFPDSVFVTSPGATRWLKGLNPGSPKHCGLEILSGTHIPPSWSGHLVANDFRSHRVCRFGVEPSGSGYISRQQPEIITTQHVAFRPIDAKMGPDGALYIADWYNPIIQHGEVDFRDERRDRTHGRIWRVSFPERELDHWPDFAELENQALVDLLADPSLSVRQFSRQELWNRTKSSGQEVQNLVNTWVNQQPEARSLEKLWIAEVVASPLPESPEQLLSQASPEARRTLLRSLWHQRQELGEDAIPGLVDFMMQQTTNPDPRIRMEAVASLGQLDAKQYPESFNAVLRATTMPIDDNIDFAIWQSLRKLDEAYSGESILAALDWTQRASQLGFAVTAIGTNQAAEVALAQLEKGNVPVGQWESMVQAISVAGNADQLGRTVARILGDDLANLSLEKLQPVLSRTGRDKTTPANINQTIQTLLSKNKTLTAEQLLTLAKIAGPWKIESAVPLMLDSIESVSGSTQKTIIASLGNFDSEQVRSELLALTKSKSPATRIAATEAVASRRPVAAIPALCDLLEDESTRDAAAGIVVGFVGKQGAAERLADAIRSRQVPADLARTLLRGVQGGGGNAELEQAIRVAGKLENASWQLTDGLKAEILSAAASTGSPARGEQIYRQSKLQCIQCHAIGNAGGLVGPNLISVGGSSQPDYILESLLLPNAKLKEGYTTLTVLTDEGDVINGIVIGKDEDAVRLRLADGKEVQIPTESIEQEKPGKSLMPAGLMDTLTKTEIIDLVAFLSALGRQPEYTVSTDPVVRAYETLIYSNEANRRLNRTSTDTAASDDAAMNWRPVTSLVNGQLPLSELDRFQQHRETPPTSFVRFTVDMPAEGVAEIRLPTKGIEAWVDTKPTPAIDLKKLKLDAGNHIIVLGIDRNQQQEPFEVTVAGDAR